MSCIRKIRTGQGDRRTQAERGRADGSDRWLGCLVDHPRVLVILRWRGVRIGSVTRETQLTLALCAPAEGDVGLDGTDELGTYADGAGTSTQVGIHHLAVGNLHGLQCTLIAPASVRASDTEHGCELGIDSIGTPAVGHPTSHCTGGGSLARLHVNRSHRAVHETRCWVVENLLRRTLGVHRGRTDSDRSLLVATPAIDLPGLDRAGVVHAHRHRGDVRVLETVGGRHISCGVLGSVARARSTEISAVLDSPADQLTAGNRTADSRSNGNVGDRFRAVVRQVLRCSDENWLLLTSEVLAQHRTGLARRRGTQLALTVLAPAIEVVPRTGSRPGDRAHRTDHLRTNRDSRDIGVHELRGRTGNTVCHLYRGA